MEKPAPTVPLCKDVEKSQHYKSRGYRLEHSIATAKAVHKHGVG